MEGFDNRAEKIAAYQERYLPEGMRSQKKVNMVIAAGMEVLYARSAEFSGLENLPETGPFIVVANHFNVKETEILLAMLKNYDAHFVAAKKIIGEHPITKLGLRMIRGIPVPESLVHLSEEEKVNLLKRIPNRIIKQKYQEVIDQEAEGQIDRSGLLEFVRSSVALLSRGDVLVIYPEGLWLYDGEDGTPRSQSLYRGLDGFNIVAEQYRKLTGKDVPIVPVGVCSENNQRKVRIGRPSVMSDNDTELSDTDWYMNQIAALLPEDQRGFYGEHHNGSKEDTP